MQSASSAVEHYITVYTFSVVKCFNLERWDDLNESIEIRTVQNYEDVITVVAFVIVKKSKKKYFSGDLWREKIFWGYNMSDVTRNDLGCSSSKKIELVVRTTSAFSLFCWVMSLLIACLHLLQNDVPLGWPSPLLYHSRYEHEHEPNIIKNQISLIYNMMK